MDQPAYTVGQVAELTGVTVRTLHHYDEIGLLAPFDRTPAGYRVYVRSDLERLQEILFFRELGFSLDEIAAVTGDPAYDRRRALARQRDLLRSRVRHMEAIIAAVDEALKAEEEGMQMSERDMFEVFGDFDPRDYEQEAAERWGETAAYAELARRTSRYTKDDWQQITGEAESIAEAFAAALRGGAPPESDSTMDIVERHRQHIDAWFYPCSHEAHDGLGAMYVADARFAAYWNEREAGLAAYVSAAITANVLRHGTAGS